MYETFMSWRAGTVHRTAKIQHCPKTAEDKSSDVPPRWLFASKKVLVYAMDLQFGILCGCRTKQEQCAANATYAVH